MKTKEYIKQLEDALRLAAVRLQSVSEGHATDARTALGVPLWYKGDILTKYSDGSNKCAFPDYKTEL